MTLTQPGAKSIENEYGWAIAIVQAHFSRGLAKLCDSRSLEARFRHFRNKQDPIYLDLLAGLENEALERTFVSYWAVGQSLATKSRFWLEEAIADILITKSRNEGRKDLRVYSQPMLGAGWRERGINVFEIGENWREEITARRPWRQLVQTSALEVIDGLVGEQERQRVRVRPDGRRARRDWDGGPPEAAKRDKACLAAVTAALKGPPATEVTLQCNLLVVEPPRLDGFPHAWGIRFISPKTLSSHPARKQERANLLRLYAFLVQEKILHDARQIEVRVAEILPRYGDFDDLDRYPDYFSSLTYWNADRLWEFVGVPFDVVAIAVRNVAAEFRERLNAGLRSLLPGARSKSR